MQSRKLLWHFYSFKIYRTAALIRTTSSNVLIVREPQRLLEPSYISIVQTQAHKSPSSRRSIAGQESNHATKKLENSEETRPKERNTLIWSITSNICNQFEITRGFCDIVSLHFITVTALREVPDPSMEND